MSTIEETRPKKCIFSHGLKFPKDDHFLGQKQKRHLRRNSYEERESIAAMQAIRDDDVVIELGAGIGYMSTLIAKKCDPKSIHAYEANPTLIPYIQEVHRVNEVKNATVTNAMLGPRKKSAQKFYIRGNYLASSMEDNVGDDLGGIIDTVDVPVLNINTVLSEIKPTFLVCDIEGAEVDLLSKANLSCLRAVLIELHPQWIGQEGIQAIFDVMAKHGLTYFPRASNGKVVLFKKDW